MARNTQDALITLMVVAAFSDTTISDHELGRIEAILASWPVFSGYDAAQLPYVANRGVDEINGAIGLDGVLDTAIAAIPERLHDTAYALVVEITVADLTLEQEELRFLEMVRDRLGVDRLLTAAIEASARARARRA